MKLKLVYLDCYETTEFKGEKYMIYRFLDPNSLIVITGTNLNLTFEQYKLYNCVVEWNSRKNKLKVISASE